ncbi:hypothetical protein Tco_1174524 [Tanacetum coccineum]
MLGIVAQNAISIRVLAAEALEAKGSCSIIVLAFKPLALSSAGGKLHILKPSCERNGITPTPKESLSPTSGSKVPNSPLTGESNLLIVKASAD